MSNLMQDPDFWAPLPPGYVWDGEQYSFVFNGTTREVLHFLSNALPPDLGTDVLAGDVYIDVEGAADSEEFKLVLADMNLVVYDSLTVYNRESTTFEFVIPANFATWAVQLMLSHSDTQVNVVTAQGNGFNLIPNAEGDNLVARDDEATTQAATAVGINVLANDTLDGEPVQLSDLVGPPTIVSPPSNGSVVVEEGGSITYTPDPGFCGVDTFEYQIETVSPSYINYVCDVTSVVSDEPSQSDDEDTCGLCNVPPWFDSELPFTVSGADWSVTYQWNAVDGRYDVLDSVNLENAPSCCDPGTGLTLTQGVNTNVLVYDFNCA